MSTTGDSEWLGHGQAQPPRAGEFCSAKWGHERRGTASFTINNAPPNKARKMWSAISSVLPSLLRREGSLLYKTSFFISLSTPNPPPTLLVTCDWEGPGGWAMAFSWWAQLETWNVATSLHDCPPGSVGRTEWPSLELMRLHSLGSAHHCRHIFSWNLFLKRQRGQNLSGTAESWRWSPLGGWVPLQIPSTGVLRCFQAAYHLKGIAILARSHKERKITHVKKAWSDIQKWLHISRLCHRQMEI